MTSRGSASENMKQYESAGSYHPRCKPARHSDRPSQSSREPHATNFLQEPNQVTRSASVELQISIPPPLPHPLPLTGPFITSEYRITLRNSRIMELWGLGLNNRLVLNYTTDTIPPALCTHRGKQRLGSRSGGIGEGVTYEKRWLGSP